MEKDAAFPADGSISAIGCIVPISLLAYMIVTRHVSLADGGTQLLRITMPLSCTSSSVIQALYLKLFQCCAARRDLNTVKQWALCFLFPSAAAEMIALIVASRPPEVNVISRARNRGTSPWYPLLLCGFGGAWR
jgi:hypothetical protein